jgi:hypothetical protein
MYQVKSAKGSEFTFFHCWVLVKDFPRWADGWGTMKQCTPSKRRASTSMHDSHEGVSEETSAMERNGELDRNAVLKERPGGTKATKAVQKVDKEKEGVAYRQAQATAVLAEVTVAKNLLLAEQNLLMLMTTPDSQISGPAALRFIRMRQEDNWRSMRLQGRKTAGDWSKRPLLLMLLELLQLGWNKKNMIEN